MSWADADNPLAVMGFVVGVKPHVHNVRPFKCNLSLVILKRSRGFRTGTA